LNQQLYDIKTRLFTESYLHKSPVPGNESNKASAFTPEIKLKYASRHAPEDGITLDPGLLIGVLKVDRQVVGDIMAVPRELVPAVDPLVQLTNKKSRN
jgi:hypothetical protein